VKMILKATSMRRARNPAANGATSIAQLEIGASYLPRALGTIPRAFAIKALARIELLVARSSLRPGKELVSDSTRTIP
jgi:hypothetical protein